MENIRLPTVHFSYVCPLCGVSPDGGPSAFILRYDLEEAAYDLAQKIDSARSGSDKSDNGLVDPELVNIMQEALETTLDTENAGYHRKDWMPDGMGRDKEKVPDPQHYVTWRWIAVGYFRDIAGHERRLPGDAPVRRVGGNDNVPDGRNIRVRTVSCRAGHEAPSRMIFSEVVISPQITGNLQEPMSKEVRSDCMIIPRRLNPNIAMCERCYHYLKYWLDTSSSPEPSLSFPGELYEIVNSQVKGRQTRGHIRGYLPCLHYKDILNCFQAKHKHFFSYIRAVKHVSQAVDAGLRGKDLVLALLKDCRSWMFMRPDLWPVPTSNSLTAAPVRSPPASVQTSSQHFSKLPIELLLYILQGLPLVNILNFATTCHALWRLVTSPSLFTHVLITPVNGDIRWVLPIHALRDEEERAKTALLLWLPHGATFLSADAPGGSEHIDGTDSRLTGQTNRISTGMNPTPSLITILSHPQFPMLNFIHACWESDSMKNRKRLWGMVKQFDRLWEGYRRNGPNDPRFFPSEEILDQLEVDEVGCRPVCEQESDRTSYHISNDSTLNQ